MTPFWWLFGRSVCFVDSGRVLLDAEMDASVVAEIRDAIKASAIEAKISDLHVWRVGKGMYSCIVSLVTTSDASPYYFKKQLEVHEELVHISVEINKRLGGPAVGIT